MNKKIKFIIILLLGIFFWGGSQTFVLADEFGLGKAATASEIPFKKVKNPQTQLTTIVGKVIAQALTFVGILFFILMIYAGIVWMLARGNDAYTQKALGTITAAIVGLIIVIGSYAITNFIFESVKMGSGG